MFVCGKEVCMRAVMRFSRLSNVCLWQGGLYEGGEKV